MDGLFPERYLSESVRKHIEQTYYARVNEQAKFENMVGNPFFWISSCIPPSIPIMA
jgi:hypothetical protein